MLLTSLASSPTCLISLQTQYRIQSKRLLFSNFKSIFSFFENFQCEKVGYPVSEAGFHGNTKGNRFFVFLAIKNLLNLKILNKQSIRNTHHSCRSKLNLFIGLYLIILPYYKTKGIEPVCFNLYIN